MTTLDVAFREDSLHGRRPIGWYATVHAERRKCNVQRLEVETTVRAQMLRRKALRDLLCRVALEEPSVQRAIEA